VDMCVTEFCYLVSSLYSTLSISPSFKIGDLWGMKALSSSGLWLISVMSKSSLKLLASLSPSILIGILLSLSLKCSSILF
jgi:hypothetical protein